MAGCTNENWTVAELSNALQDKHKENKKIVVPMFQRGERWNKAQQQDFIDSLIKGYPVGTLLFYEKYENKQRTYILVDGLQRSNCIRNYMMCPTEFFYDSSIPDEVCSSILARLNADHVGNYGTVRTELTNFIKQQKTFKNIQFFSVAGIIAKKFCEQIDLSSVGDVTNIITEFFADKQSLYESISSTVIPVNVYSGDEAALPEIFERINAKGTPLDRYEIYAAAWPVEDKFKIDNQNIIEYLIKKYDSLVNEDYSIDGYDREQFRLNREVNAFEYLFGLSRFLVDKYEILAFGKKLTDDRVNSLAYELVNACLNDSDKIGTLYESLLSIDINQFEKALLQAVDFVSESVSVITKFKGNTRRSVKLLHSKYQIMSMISTSFKEMYCGNDFKNVAPDWNDKKQVIARNLVQYYAYDIITDYWSSGGTKKIFAVAKPNRYMSELSGKAWAVALDSFFEHSMQRKEKVKIESPKSEEYVILNCIYVSTFTAMDQLSINKFDVEHIAPKEQMKRLIDSCRGDGLPISCIANLCYLPEYENRSKRDKNFYQDAKYLEHTEKEDLEWMDIPYETLDGFKSLKEYYTDYCTKRFDKLKRLFCDSLGIPFVSADSDDDSEQAVIPAVKQSHPEQHRPMLFSANCVQRLAEKTGSDLVKLSRGTYKTQDNENGYTVVTSKAYFQGNRERFWFAYRRTTRVADCKKRYYVFGCKDESTVIVLPVSLIENNIDRLNCSRDDDGNITHWHIAFFRDTNNHLTWLLSKPETEEIGIDQYLLE